MQAGTDVRVRGSKKNYVRASHMRWHFNRGIVSPKCAFCTEKVPVGSSSSAGNEPADAQTQPLSVILEQQAERLRRRERKLEQMRQFTANRREVARTAHGKTTRKEICSNAGKIRAHERWHVSRGIVSPKCELCRFPNRSQSGVESGNGKV